VVRRAGDWQLGLWLFVIANIASAVNMTFYDSLLPHIASADEVDVVSSSAYAIGYLGGGLLLIVNLSGSRIRRGSASPTPPLRPACRS